MGAELPLHVVVTILECCVTFSGVKLSIRSFVLFITGTKYNLILISNERATACMNIHLFTCKHCDVINFINSY